MRAEVGRRGVLAVAAAAAVALAAFAYGARTPGLPGGPLGEDRGGGGVGIPAAVGQPVSVALLGMRNAGDVPVEIREVELVGADPALRFVGALVFRGSSQLGSARGFPPPLPGRGREAAVEASGARIAPGETFDVIIGYAASRPGEHGFEQVAVRYRARGLPYRFVESLDGHVCAPEKRGCPSFDDF